MTTTETTVEKLVTSAERGRGLWIGLDVERSARHELLRLELETAGVKLTDDTHVTLAHLGKSCGRREVEAAVTACRVASGMMNTTDVSVEGLCRLRDHVAALLAPRWIDQLCSLVERCLVDHHVYVDKSFAGVRHATIGTIKGPVSMPRVDSYLLRCSSMMVVCGGEELSFSLLLPKPEIF